MCYWWVYSSSAHSLVWNRKWLPLCEGRKHAWCWSTTSTTISCSLQQKVKIKVQRQMSLNVMQSFKFPAAALCMGLMPPSSKGVALNLETAIRQNLLISILFSLLVARWWWQTTWKSTFHLERPSTHSSSCGGSLVRKNLNDLPH